MWVSQSHAFRMENQYIFFRNDQTTDYRIVNPTTPDCLDDVGYPYFGRVLNRLSERLKHSGLVFYITGWTVKELPSYGSNVIACILQDEWSREPYYRHRVGAILKAYGPRPTHLEANQFGSPYEKGMNLLAYAKALLKDRGGRSLSSIRKQLYASKLAPIIHLPLGCYAYANVPYIPFANRPYDVYFKGSAQHRNKPFRRLKSPKELARLRMEKALESLQSNCPNVKTFFQKTGSFRESINSDRNSYLENMMRTRFALIPRGANLETFRFYEAIRYGCIPVGEVFPCSYIYDNAPIVRLKDWSDLDQVLSQLLSNPAKLQSLHQQALQWWRDIVSEEACTNMILEALAKLNEVS